MFSRHLTAFGSNWFPPTQALLGGWRTSHFPSHPWWLGVPPRPQLSHPTRHMSGAFRPLDPHSVNWARQPPPGFPFHGFPQRPFHLSGMERSDREPPYKRRRSTEERSPGDTSKASPKREVPRQARSATPSPNYWFKDGTRESAAPGESPARPQRSRQTKGKSPGYSL